jgi:hypothetical protein
VLTLLLLLFLVIVVWSVVSISRRRRRALEDLKTFFARAIAGEYGLNLMHVSTGDLIGGIVGQPAQNIDKAFETALRNLPCLLFFDEFDSVAQRRDGTPDQESRRTVNQPLTSLEAHRDERELLVMAATNSIDHLDPAVIGHGRLRPPHQDRPPRRRGPARDLRRRARRTVTRSSPDDPTPAVEQEDFDQALERHRASTAARAIA